MSGKRRPDHPNRMLVEGNDDANALAHIALLAGFVDGSGETIFEASDVRGIERMPLAVATWIKPGSTARRLGIVVDADDNLTGRWESLREALKEGYVLPDRPLEGGVILRSDDADRPIIGIWLMPDNQAFGALEEFLLTFIPSSDELISCAKRAVAGLPVEHCLFLPTGRSKALLHTWLAWQERPGMPFGTAIKAGCFSTKEILANPFIGWLRQLFVE